jgi:hypothetical protein
MMKEENDPKHFIESIFDEYANATPTIIEGYTNALEMLSQQLYAVDTRFVLELLQNADDNEYDIATTPAVIVKYEDDKFVFINNELGFKAPNVKALCSTGKSTKANRKQKYTGEKGIGFKSVFKVSDCPHIHSGGFHFKFDLKGEHNFRYLAPIWIPSDNQAQGTKIVLPVSTLEEAREAFNDSREELNSEILLFLRRVKRLEIHEANSQSREVFTRSDEPVSDNNDVRFVKLTENDNERTYYVRDQLIDMEDIEEEKRAELADTNIVIAFPLDEEGSADLSRDRSLYSFLPIKRGPFKFILQADFVLTLNREDILEGKKWNQRIRDKIPKTLVKAILSARTVPKLRETILSFVEHDNGSSEFLDDVLPKAKEKLANKKCILTTDETWDKPASTYIRDDFRLIRDGVVTPEDVERFFDGKIVHEGFKASESLLEELGCIKFECYEFKKLLSDDEFWANRDLKWYYQIYQKISLLFKEKHLSSSDIALMRDNLRIPIENEEFKKLDDNTYIFTSLSKKKKYGFEHELDILSEEFLKSFKESERATLRELLNELSVGEAKPKDIIEKYIKEFYDNSHDLEDLEDADGIAIRGHIKYLKDHYKEYKRDSSEDFEELTESIALRTKKCTHSTEFEYPKALYLCLELSDTNLEDHSNPDHAGKFICIEGLGVDLEKKKVVKAWKTFFEALGVSDVPRVEDDLFTSIITSTDSKTKEWFITCILDPNWGEYYQSRMSHEIFGEPVIEYIQALPVETRDGRPKELGKTYLYDEKIEAIFGSNLPLLKWELKNNDFIDDVGIIRELSFDSVIQRLEQLSAKENLDAKEIARIYIWLQGNWHEGTNPIDLFRSKELIFIPYLKKWVTSSDCILKRPREMEPVKNLLSFGSVREYDDLGRFFGEQLEIEVDLSPQQWIEILSKYWELDDFSEYKKQLVSTFQQIDKLLDQDIWSSELDAEISFVNRKFQPWENDDDLLAVDDEELYEHFQDHPSVSFFLPDAGDLPGLSRFLDHFNIRKISDEVDPNLSENEQGIKAPEIEAVIKKRWMDIARLVRGNDDRDRYETLRDNGSLRKLQETCVSLVNNLTVLVELRESSLEIKQDVIADDKQPVPTFLLDQSKKDKWCPFIADEICKNLGCDSLSDSVRIILNAESKEDLEDEFKRWKTAPLPEEEIARLKGEEWIEPQDEEESITPAEPQIPTGDGQVEPPEDRKGDGEEGIEPSDEEDPQGESEQTDKEEGQQTDESEEGDSVKEKGIEGDESEGGEAGPDKGLAGSQGQGEAKDTSAGPSPSGADKEADEEILDDLCDVLDTAVKAGKLSDEEADKVFDKAKETPPPITPDTKSGRDSSGIEEGDEFDDQLEGDRYGDSPGGGKPTGPRAPRTSSRGSWKKKRGRKGRPGKRKDFVSYVNVNPSKGEQNESPEAIERRRNVDKAAVAFAMKYLNRTKPGFEVIEMPHDNPGYDIELVNTQNNQKLFIEVKGTAGSWGKGVTMTWKQFQFSLKHRGQSYLFVVEHALTPKRTSLCEIKDPAHLAQRFVFDQGWKEFAEGQNNEVTKQKKELDPLIGKKIRWGNGGAEIIKIEKVPDSSKLVVHFSTVGGPHHKSFLSLRMLKQQLYNG